jgi:hypothetical protein
VKWFGTAFSKLQIADRLSAPLNRALHARSWKEREKALGGGYEIVAAAFNDLEIAPRLTLEPVRLWGRPFTVMWADFPGALSAAISDPQVHRCATWSSAGRPAALIKCETFSGRLSRVLRCANLQGSKSSA